MANHLARSAQFDYTYAPFNYLTSSSTALAIVIFSLAYTAMLAHIYSLIWGHQTCGSKSSTQVLVTFTSMFSYMVLILVRLVAWVWHGYEVTNGYDIVAMPSLVYVVVLTAHLGLSAMRAWCGGQLSLEHEEADCGIWHANEREWYTQTNNGMHSPMDMKVEDCRSDRACRDPWVTRIDAATRSVL